MIIEVYDALIEAGASAEKAKLASSAIANESLATKDDINALKKDIHKVDKRIVRLEVIMSILLAIQVIPILKDFLQ